MTRVDTGTMVRYTAPGSRNTEGVPRIVPAVVLGQWPDGSLQLYALHFEGAFLVNAAPLGDVDIPPDRCRDMEERIAELENRVAALSRESHEPLVRASSDRFLTAEIHDAV
jgi:hypothetical protein